MNILMSAYMNRTDNIRSLFEIIRLVWKSCETDTNWKEKRYILTIPNYRVRKGIAKNYIIIFGRLKYFKMCSKFYDINCDFWIVMNVVVDVINSIYETAIIPKQWSSRTLWLFPKKQNRKLCRSQNNSSNVHLKHSWKLDNYEIPDYDA